MTTHYVSQLPGFTTTGCNAEVIEKALQGTVGHTLIFDAITPVARNVVLTNVHGLTITGPCGLVAQRQLSWLLQLTYCAVPRIDNLWVNCNGVAYGGIKLTRCDKPTVERTTVTSSGSPKVANARGITLAGCCDALVERCHLDNIQSSRGAGGLTCMDDSGYHCQRPVIRHNRFTNIQPKRDADGIRLFGRDFSMQAVIHGNTFDRVAKSAIKTQTNDCIITDNRITGTDLIGIRCQVGKGHTISGNVIDGARTGILVWCDKDGQLRANLDDNRIRNARTGFAIYGEPGKTVVGCSIAGSFVKDVERHIYLNCDCIEHTEFYNHELHYSKRYKGTRQ